MITILEDLSYFLGRAICHQLPERSFMINGHYLPVCARDTGIYLGVFCSLLFIIIMKKYRSTNIPNMKISFILLLFLFPLIIDGFGSYLGIYTTTNLIRLVTGLLFGIALPFFLVPLLSHSSSERDIPILSTLCEIIYPFLFAMVIAFLTYQSILPFTILSIAIIGTLICWISLLFLLVYHSMKNRYLSYSISLCSSILTLIILSYSHSIIRPLYLQYL